jgi:type III restriction enzyme
MSPRRAAPPAVAQPEALPRTARVEVEQPILNSPYDEPARHWYIQRGADPELRDGRRKSFVFQPRGQREEWDLSDGTLAPLREYESAYEMVLVNLLRERVQQWRAAGYPGVTRATLELLRWWRREGREKRLFFAQLEAAETVIFLREARGDLLQGVSVPRDVHSAENGDDAGFLRYACKMATGGGKTVVMGMLAGWSILNKVVNRSDGRFSDSVLVVCPNITIRDRLRELDPATGEASIYRTRDLVPPELMPLMARGRLFVTNWHVFEAQETARVGDDSARVVKAGIAQDRTEIVYIGERSTTARGRRYLTFEDYTRQVAAGILFVEGEVHDERGGLKSARVFQRRYVESDTALVTRVLGRELGRKENILVLNDEAHHAYRITQGAEEESDEESLLGTADDDDIIAQEATVWVEGLDRVHRQRGINFCVDLSATPYFLARAGRDTARPFPWTVSDFGFIDAIESGLVKIPQLAAADTTGAERAQYYNVWQWIMGKLTAAERGGGRATPKPEAVLKYAAQPLALLAGDWRAEFERWREREDPRPPVLIVVCKDIKLAKVIYDWIAEDTRPTGIPSFAVTELRNAGGRINTIRVDTKVIAESDTEGAKNDEVRWMRLTLDTIGKLDWPRDSQGRSLYPAGTQELAKKLERADERGDFPPPGRDVRCIVSVGMLTEGWDANTVTHIIGLRPFMSQLLCEQVVGRGLRRASYELNENGLFDEEVAQVFGVPFEIVPFKSGAGPPAERQRRFHVYALPGRERYEIRFPRVEGYTQAVSARLKVDWTRVPALHLKPGDYPTLVTMRGSAVDTSGTMAPRGPGRLREIGLDKYRALQRVQRREFEMAAALTRDLRAQREDAAPAHVLFPQLLEVVQRYVRERVIPAPQTELVDLFNSPYYGWAVEQLLQHIQPDTDGEASELPRLEPLRPEGSTAEVDFWTSRPVREAQKSHVNYVVADTAQWEQQAAFYIDRHQAVAAFVKNAGLGFAIPYLHNGQMHDFVADFLVRFEGDESRHLVLETKGYDELAEVKEAAAQRWVDAVNADGRWGAWRFRMARSVADVSYILDEEANAVWGAQVVAPV